MRKGKKTISAEEDKKNHKNRKEWSTKRKREESKEMKDKNTEEEWRESEGGKEVVTLPPMYTITSITNKSKVRAPPSLFSGSLSGYLQFYTRIIKTRNTVYKEFVSWFLMLYFIPIIHCLVKFSLIIIINVFPVSFFKLIIFKRLSLLFLKGC